MRDFRQYSVWQDAFSVVKDIYEIVQALPPTEKFGLASQMSRAAVSVPSNISEGCSRSSDIEFKRFLEIAEGSAFELETQLLLCAELGFCSKERADEVLKKLNAIQASINALIQKIKKDNRKTQ